MIEALLSGKLAGKPELLHSKTGKPYVRAKLRVRSRGRYLDDNGREKTRSQSK